jgi:hypothetical protein
MNGKIWSWSSGQVDQKPNQSSHYWYNNEVILFQLLEITYKELHWLRIQYKWFKFVLFCLLIVYFLNRDAHQSLLATRVRTIDLLNACPETCRVLKDAFSLEVHTITLLHTTILNYTVKCFSSSRCFVFHRCWILYFVNVGRCGVVPLTMCVIDFWVRILGNDYDNYEKSSFFVHFISSISKQRIKEFKHC